MIELKEELQGEIVSQGQIVASMISQKGAKGDKGDKGDSGNSATISVGTVTTGSPGTQATVTNVGTSTDAIFDFVIPRGQDGSGGGGGGDMYKSTYDQNDNGIVDNAEKVNNHTVQSDVPADAVFTDTTYTAGTNVSISAQNVISATDTTYTAGTGIEITAGNVINNTQTSAKWGNITGTLNDQADLKSALDAKGTYSKPSGGIPKTDLANAVQTSLGKADTAIQSSDLSTVATSGSYNDLTNKPTIPTVNNATLTLQKNGTTLDTFTANSSVDKTINISIPTKVSDVTNDTGFITRTVNNLTNYTPSSTIDMYFGTYDTFLANKQKKVIIQSTQPDSATTGDLWIDTSNDNRLKYFDGTSWVGVSDNVSNTKSDSTTKTYSCDYVNQIGVPIEFFGDVGGDQNNTYNFHCIGKVVATKISTDGIWKFDIQAPITFNTGSANYFSWGIMPSKISALLNDKIGVQVQYDASLRKSCVYKMFTTAGGYDYSHVGYGSLFEWADNTYLLFARYYTDTGSAGGWTLDSFTSGQQILATIYLREV